MRKIKVGARAVAVPSMALVVLGVATPAHALIGGHPASQPYPGMASVQVATPTDPDHHRCAATVIDRRYLQTNAHCVTRADGSAMLPELFHVRIGSPDRTRGGIVRAVSAVLPHAAWDWASGDDPVSDIALLRLDRPVPLPPAGVARRLAHHPQTRLLGWGVTDPAATDIPVQLRELDTTIVAAEHCSGGAITAGEICVASPEGDAGPCYGDSGGPALQPVSARSSRWAVVASTSRETAQDCSGGASLTDVTYYRHWIEQVIGIGTVPPRTDPGISSQASGATPRALIWPVTPVA